MARDDKLVKVGPLLSRVPGWKSFLLESARKKQNELIELHTRTGRPLGSESFIGNLEVLCGRIFRKGKPGPKPYKS